MRTASAVVQEFWALMRSNDFVAVGNVLSDAFVLEWPQSQERIRGAANFAAMNAAYPAHGQWQFIINQTVGNETEVVTDVTISDGVQQARALTFFTVAQGKIVKITEFWPEPFAAAPWRSHLVEPMQRGMFAAIHLRELQDSDLPIFFAQQLDPAANEMAAFTAKDPSDKAAFQRHWQRIRSDPTVIIRTILYGNQIVGSVSSYEDAGKPEVTYWLGKEFWGKGLATQALTQFLATVDPRRPMQARVAKDNHGSRRVLEKCGFVIVGEDKGFANARKAETEEWLLTLA